MFRIHLVLRKDDDLKIMLKEIMLKPNGHVHAEAGGLSVPSGTVGFGCGALKYSRQCLRASMWPRTGPAFGFLS